MAEEQHSLWNAFRRQPSEETFRPLYEGTRKLVYTLCHRILRNEEDARDAFQAVYCRLLELARGRRGAHEDAPVENIVYRLAVREADNLRKRRRRRSRKEVAMDAAHLPGTQPPPDRIAADRQLRELVERLVDQLPDRYRLPLQLHYFHGRSHAEVARILGQPAGTVSVHISRALGKLDPLMRRAGLGRAVGVLGAFLVGSEMLSPPAAFSASLVFTKAEAAVAAGGATAAAASAASISGKVVAGISIMNAKTVTFSIAVALAVLALLSFELMRPPPAGREPERVVEREAGDREPAPVEPREADRPKEPATEEEPAVAAAPRSVLRGVVVDALTEEPIEGARISVRLIGNTQTTTDVDGRFEFLDLEPGRHEIQALSATHVAVTKNVTVTGEGEDLCRFELERGVEVDVLVVDEDDRPVEGAFVYAQPGIINRSTGPDGRVRVGPIRADGRHDVYASKEGYGYPGPTQPVFEPGEPRGSVTIVLESRAIVHAVFEGRVTDPDGEPVAGADVIWGGPYNVQGASDRTETDEEGYYRLEAHEDEPDQLSVLADGFALAWKESLPRGTPEEPTVVDFSLSEGHPIEGVVVDAEDRPIEGAEITVYSKTDSGSIFELLRTGRPRTDAAGRFRFEHLPGLRVRLEVRGPGASWTHLRGWSLFQEWFAVDQSVRIVLEREGVIRLRVVDDETGEAVPSFVVRHSGRTDSTRAVGDSVERQEGRFVLSNLTQGEEYEVMVEANGYLPQRKSGVRAQPRDDAEELVFELSRGTALEGVVIDAGTSAPIAGAEIVYGANRSNRMWISWNDVRSDIGSQLENVQKVQSDDAGYFAIQEGVRAGILFIRARSYERKIITPENRDPFQVGGRLRIPMSPGASVSGAYLRGGEPQPDATVYLRRIDGRAQNFKPQVTDGDGKYRWEGLAAGSYELSSIVGEGASRSSAWLRRKFEVASGEDKEVDLGGDMGPWSLAGRVHEGEEPLYRVKVGLKALFAWDYEKLELFTDAEGRFQFDGLENGEYEIQAVRWDPTFRIVKRKLQIASDARRDLEFAAVHAVTGRLRFPESVGDDTISMIEEILLVAVESERSSRDDSDQLSGSGTGALKGTDFEIPGRFRGEYRLSVRYRAGEDLVTIGFPRTLYIDNLAGDRDLGEVAAPALGSLRIRVRVDPPGAPRPRTIWVFFYEPGREKRLSSVVLESKRSEVTIDAINAGSYRVRPSASGFLGEPREVVVTVRAGDMASVDLALRPIGLVEGRVTDAAAPERKVRPRRVTLVGKGARRVLEAERSPGAAADRLEENRYRFSDLEAGTYRVRIEADGYRPEEYSIEVKPGLYEFPRSIALEPDGRE